MRYDNKTIVEAYKDKVKDAESVFITDYAGLNQSDYIELRNLLDKESAMHKVIKNRIFKHIMEETSKVEAGKLNGMLKGPSSFTIGGNDVVIVAKVLVDFAKKHDALKIKGGILDGNILNKDQVKDLAALPSRHELIAKTVGTIGAPLSNFVGVLSACIRNLVNVVHAYKDKKESENK